MRPPTEFTRGEGGDDACHLPKVGNLDIDCSSIIEGQAEPFGALIGGAVHCPAFFVAAGSEKNRKPGKMMPRRAVEGVLRSQNVETDLHEITFGQSRDQLRFPQPGSTPDAPHDLCSS